MPERTARPHPFCNRSCHDAFHGDERCCAAYTHVLDCNTPHRHSRACPALPWTVAAAKFHFCAHCGATLDARHSRVRTDDTAAASPR